MTDETAGLGHNQPPPDPLLAALEEEFIDLQSQHGALELEIRKLPKQPATDEEAAQVTSWVIRARKLAAGTERQREDRKKPILAMGRTIDGFFNGIRDGLRNRASEIERRNAPYLAAKKAKEEAAAAEHARIAREEEQKRQAAAAEARRLEQEAARKAQEAQDALAAAERTRIADAAEAARLSRETAKPTAVPNPEPQPDLLEAARAAERDAQQASRAAEIAEKEAGKATNAADRADRQAAAGPLERTTGGGGAAKLATTWRPRVTSWPMVIQSLGPIGPFLNETIIFTALERMAKKEPRPDAPPGVVFTEQTGVATHATRSQP